MAGDREADADTLARKIAALRIFKDDAGKMNLPLAAVDGAVLVVSQFTLAADGMESGNRPGFSRAAPPAEGERLYQRFLFCPEQSRIAGRDRRLRRGHAGEPWSTMAR